MENISCTESLKQLLDYKQRQYAEGDRATSIRGMAVMNLVYTLVTDMQAMDNELIKNTCFQSSSR